MRSPAPQLHAPARGLHAVRRAAVLTALCGLALAGHASPVAGQSPPAPPPRSERADWLGATVNIAFAGGTVGEYVAALRSAAAETPINVAFTGGVEELAMPPVSFRGVQLDTAIRSIANLAAPRGGRVRVLGSGDQQPPGFGVGAPMFVVSLERPREADGAETITRVMSLAALTAPRADPASGLTADVALSAVEAALQADRAAGTPADIRFHKDSGLLFVTGTRGQCILIEEVLARLESDAKARARPVPKPATERFNLAHTPAAAVADALRTVFPQSPDQPARVSVQADPQGNAAVVSTTEDYITAVRAILRLIDRDPDEIPAVADARAAEAAARTQLELVLRERDRAVARCAEIDEHARLARADAEAARARAEALQNEIAALRKQLDALRAEADKRFEDSRRAAEVSHAQFRQAQDELERARQTIKTLRDELEAAKKAPK